MYWIHRITVLVALLQPVVAFTAVRPEAAAAPKNKKEPSTTHPSSALHVSIGLGSGEPNKTLEEKELVAGVDYEIPNHEEHRLDRRSKLDEQCDAWFGKLMEGDHGSFPDLAQDAYQKLTTLPVLRNDVEKPSDDPEWTPYVNT